MKKNTMTFLNNFLETIEKILIFVIFQNTKNGETIFDLYNLNYYEI